ncbi:molybdopterin molybdotransferase MoeA [Citromicrobium bathyomarinum]|uniref:molybdopterin molybdotransferase MoeA n=1 Tax=Sphingomonadales TaxID=204457 RepID=UPI000C562F55|nr:molybdopterin molybdenumtransferase MoeA [Citromicrobium sp.]|tara:strand:- start:103316 stop:104500 length:1185 start_codon:yes stop_codon:yes gene_type:complete
MSAPLDLEEAQARLLAMLRPGTSTTIPVNESAGRFLAEPAIARRSQPPVDLSAMDGYATCGEGPWRIKGESRAGAPYDKVLGKGEAVRISTGAQMPLGADAVLVQEDAEVDGSHLTASAPPTARFIRRAGLDFGASDTLLKVGTRMGPAQIALARAGGLPEVVAYETPHVAIIESGDELCADPQDCPSPKIPAVNGAMLAQMAREAGGETTATGPVPDDADALVRAIEEAADASLIVISGGASVGPHDLVKPALEAAGFSLDFWRVAIKPGKPLLVARRRHSVVLGLPGNPVSSFVTGFLFMAPAIRKLAGACRCLTRPIPMPLATALPPGGRRREFLRASWTDDGVSPAAVQDSSALRPLAEAQVLIDRPANAVASEPGAFVPCYPLANGGYA